MFCLFFFSNTLQAQSNNTFVPSEVYPNPFSSKTRIKLNKKIETIEEISIYDAIGNLIFSFKLNGVEEDFVEWNGTNFGGNSVNSGTYICFIRTTKRSESILIQKN